VAVWEPEIVVEEPLARRLLEQFPELERAPLRRLAHGWDYTVWLVGERYAFRFPRRQMVVSGTEREIAVLPKLGPLLPLPVPVPLFVGRPTDEYPWPFFGSAFLPGSEVAEAGLDDEARLEVALQLAGFMRTLHSVELDEPLPVDVNGRADMTRRVPLARESLGELARQGLWRASGEVGELLADAERLPPSTFEAVVHGDLHVRQFVVEGPRVTGVIDWVDVCRSDPAIDLSLLWSFLPAGSRSAFLDAYGPVDDSQLVRARVLAFSLGSAIALSAHAHGLSAVTREALAGLELARDGRYNA
jgi:aminoglycoside phosphotransferase (APT) family kinase protein